MEKLSMQEQLLDTLLKTVELLPTIVTAATYIETHPADPEIQQLKQQTQFAVDKVLSCMNQIPEGKDDLVLHTGGEIRRQIGLGTSVGNQLNDWRDRCTALFISSIGRIVLEVNRLNPELARQVFPLIMPLSIDKVSKIRLVLHLAQLCGRTLPEEVYRNMLSLFREYPDILANVNNVKNTKYVFRESEQRTFTSCPVCGGKGRPYFCSLSFAMQHFDYPFYPVKLWMQCGQCENLFTYQFPKAALESGTPPKWIQPDPHDWNTFSGHPYLQIWGNIINTLKQFTTGTDVLEVGIGSGAFLAVALEMGYTADAVEIVEQAAHSVSDMLDLPIWCGDFLKFQTEKQYSIITMGDVLEHVTDPRKALEKAAALLKDDGILWLSTPNYESSFSKLRKFGDPMWMEPHHITYFNYRGLEKLLSDCGLQVLRYEISARYNGSMELFIAKSDASKR